MGASGQRNLTIICQGSIFVLTRALRVSISREDPPQPEDKLPYWAFSSCYSMQNCTNCCLRKGSIRNNRFWGFIIYSDPTLLTRK